MNYQSAETDGWWCDPGPWAYYQDGGYEEEEWPPAEEDEPNEVPNDEVLASLQGEQREYEEQKKELEGMLAENDRNLEQARRAVAQAARDRGWQGGVQQRQPKQTSTYMSKGKPKGQGLGKGKKGAKFAWVAAKGKKGYKGNFPKQGSKPGAKNGKGPGNWGSAFHLSTVQGLKIFSTSERDAKTEGKEMMASEGLVDTGATATAGGQTAVERLCAAVVATRPDARILVQEHERPYFRYGSGKWRRALYKVEIVCDQSVFAVYALPSEGVPVLIGMRELKVMDVLLGCASGRCLIAKKMFPLRSTPKGHLVMDIVKRVFSGDPQGPSQQAKRKPTTSAGTSTTRPSASTTTSSARWTKPTYRWVPKRKPMQAALPQKSVTFAPPHVQYYHGYMLDFQWDSEAVCLSEQAVDAVQVSEAEVQKQASFLGISKDEARYLLLGSSAMSSSDSQRSRYPRSLCGHGGERQPGPHHRDGAGDPGGSSRERAPRRGRGDAEATPQGQGQGSWRSRQNGVRHDENPRPGRSRPQVEERPMAMLWPARHDNRSQPIWPLERVQPVRLPPQLHPGQGCPRRSSRRPIFPSTPWRRSNDFAEKAGRQRA